MADRFLSRWARLKSEGGQRGPAPPGKAPAGGAPQPPQGGQDIASLDPAAGNAAARADRPAGAPGTTSTTAPVQDPNLDLPSLDSLTPDSDFTPFLRSGVAAATRSAALKTLFTDPHYNIMDGLDIYIGDYTQSDPIPDDVLRKLTQSRTLGLFDDPPKPENELLAGNPADVQPQSEASAAPVSAPEGHDAADGNAGQEPLQSADVQAGAAGQGGAAAPVPGAEGAEGAADPGVAGVPAPDGVDKDERSA